MCNLNNNASRFFIFCACLVMVSNVTTSFSSFISAISPSLSVAQAISSPILALLMIFSGTLLNIEYNLD